MLVESILIATVVPGSGVLIAALGAIGGLALTRGRVGLRGTTLVAPWLWAVGAWSALALVEVSTAWNGSGSDSRWIGHARYAAAVATIAPGIAVFGSKRPQNRAWQWIVLSLLVVLLLPSGEALLVRTSGAPSLHAARRWFVAVLALAGPLNYCTTRWWPSTALCLGGQFCLLAEYLPWSSAERSDIRALVGLCLIAIALALVALGWPRRRGEARGVERVWVDFCDTFGLVWGARVAERYMASRPDESLALEFRRCTVTGEAPTEASQRALRALLRRFVSNDWIRDRSVET